MKKYLAEFIGTFFFTFTIGTAAVHGASPDGVGSSFAALASGLVLMAMVYAGGHTSGAHYNPAITLGAFVRGRCEKKDVGPYIISQLLAAFVGGAAASIVTGIDSAPVMSFDNTAAVLLSEFLFTFALTFVFLKSSTASANVGNSFYGLAVGGTFAAGVITVGSISLGGFNPAVSLIFAISGKLSWVDSWMHFLPQVLAGLSAGFAFKAIGPDEL